MENHCKIFNINFDIVFNFFEYCYNLLFRNVKTRHYLLFERLQKHHSYSHSHAVNTNIKTSLFTPMKLIYTTTNSTKKLSLMLKKDMKSHHTSLAKDKSYSGCLRAAQESMELIQSPQRSKPTQRQFTQSITLSKCSFKPNHPTNSTLKSTVF